MFRVPMDIDVAEIADAANSTIIMIQPYYVYEVIDNGSVRYKRRHYSTKDVNMIKYRTEYKNGFEISCFRGSSYFDEKNFSLYDEFTTYWAAIEFNYDLDGLNNDDEKLDLMARQDAANLAEFVMCIFSPNIVKITHSYLAEDLENILSREKPNTSSNLIFECEGGGRRRVQFLFA